MRLLLLARLSQLAKGQTGMDTQDIDAREWAEENGHEIIATVSDRISGTSAMWNRPNARPWVTNENLMTAYDGIVVAKQDRLSRADWRDEANLRIWAEENHKTLFVVDRDMRWPPRDDSHHDDDITAWNRGAEEAHREWNNTSKRYRRMHRELREQGFFVGKCPYGFRIVVVEGTDHKTLAIDPVTGPIVKAMAKRYLDGQSLRQIRDWLISAAIPAPQPPKGRQGFGWSAQAVKRILRNPAITGRIQVKGHTYMRVPELIEPKDYERIQEMLSSKATRGPQQNTAMLTGIIKCQDGNPMHRIHGREIPSVPNGLYYYCQADRCPKGHRLLIPLDQADKAVNDAVMARGWAPHYTIEITPAEEYANDIARVKQDIRELDPEADDYDAKLAAKRAELRDYRSKDKGKPAERKPKLDGKTIGQVWEALDTAGRRAWLLDRGWQAIAIRTSDGYVVEVKPGEFLADIMSLAYVAPSEAVDPK